MAKITLWWPEHFIKMTEMAENVIKRYSKHLLFYKNWHETAREHLSAFQTAPFVLNKSTSFCIFNKALGRFFNSKPLPPGNESLAKTRPPGQWKVRIPGGRLWGWSGLELTDALGWVDIILFTGVNIVFWNCQNLRPKRKELQNYVLENQIDILALSETFLKPKLNFGLPGYDISKNSRLVGTKGGVTILVKKDINVKQEWKTNVLMS